MDQYNSLKILRLIVVMTHGYLKCCNVSLLIYRGLDFDPCARAGVCSCLRSCYRFINLDNCVFCSMCLTSMCGCLFMSYLFLGPDPLPREFFLNNLEKYN